MPSLFYFVSLGGNKYKACLDSLYNGKYKHVTFWRYITLRRVTRLPVGATGVNQRQPVFPSTQRVWWCAGCCRWPSDGSWCSPLGRAASSCGMVSDMSYLDPILCTYSLNAEQFVSKKCVWNNSQRSLRYVHIISAPGSVL